MELRQLRYFDLVCRYKSISKAAEALFMSQQGVSKQIAGLEKELGTSLFLRSSQGVELTEDGKYFYEQAQIILEAQKKILAHFPGPGSETQQTLRIGVSNGLGAYFDQRFFQGFSQRHREIRLLLSSLWDPLTAEGIHKDSIDAGFTLSPVHLPGLHLEPVLEVPLWCIVNVEHPLAARDHVTLDDILDHTIAMVNENFNSYHGFSRLCEKKRRSPEVVKMFDLLSIYDFVNQRPDAVGFTLDIYRSAIRYPKVVYLPIRDPDAHCSICLAWKEGNDSRLVRAFADYTREQIREREDRGGFSQPQEGG